MARIWRDPFIGVLDDQRSLEAAIPLLEASLASARIREG